MQVLKDIGSCIKNFVDLTFTNRQEVAAADVARVAMVRTVGGSLTSAAVDFDCSAAAVRVFSTEKSSNQNSSTI